jgi:hypothetical protein
MCSTAIMSIVIHLITRYERSAISEKILEW